MIFFVGELFGQEFAGSHVHSATPQFELCTANDMCRWQFYPLSMYKCVLDCSTCMETSVIRVYNSTLIHDSN